MPEEPTTSADPEEVLRSIEAWNHGDFDALMALYSTDAVLDMGVEVLEGREAIRGFFEDWSVAYEEYVSELREFRDLGNGVTFVVLRQGGRPEGSGGFVELRYALVATWAGGLVERATSYADIDEARAAAERLAEERG
jgi:ketosteroid isomerase-like protein